jgi:hypothetical protein
MERQNGIGEGKLQSKKQNELAKNKSSFGRLILSNHPCSFALCFSSASGQPMEGKTKFLFERKE